jgi:Family of unknown function (DUF6151)
LKEQGQTRRTASPRRRPALAPIAPYCKDCQAFAHFLGRAGVLDPAGGTDIFQMPPGRLKLTAGTDAMQCLRLSSKVLRWYTECCHTPIANTAARPGFPVAGVIHSFMDHGAGNRSQDDAALPHLRTLRRRASPAQRAWPAIARRSRPPRDTDARLVDARARLAVAVLRRADEGSARRASRAHAKRARRRLSLIAQTCLGCSGGFSTSFPLFQGLGERQGKLHFELCPRFLSFYV